MNGKGVVGASIDRREDPPLLTGDAEYTDDLRYPRTAHLAILRSRYGHARIAGVDASAAEARAGVLGAFVAGDVEDSSVSNRMPRSRISDDVRAPTHRVLAGDRVRYQGEPIAAVVAEDRYAAYDALDAIEVDYERLAAVTDPAEAVEGGAPTLHAGAPSNVAFESEIGEREAADEAFEDAAHTTSLELVNNRVVPAAMEPRGAIARYTPSTGALTVDLPTQKPHEHRHDLAEVLGVPDHKVRVRTPDIGGGFGSKFQRYPDEVIAAWTAMQLGRPVKWHARRSDGFLSTIHGRDHVTEVELAVDGSGDIVGLRAETHANLGAYLLTGGGRARVPENYGRMLSGQYDVPAIYCRVVGAYTNTAPVDTYRGAGGPEATYAIERIVARAAKELRTDPVDFRRRNFIPEGSFPFEVATGQVYDSGGYERSLEEALEAVDYGAFRERQAERREEGRYLGIGLSCFVESGGASPGRPECGLVRFHPSGTVTAYTGTSDHGQGLETTFAQVVANELGVPYEDVEVADGDTAEAPEGHGTSGSRGAAVGGSALVRSAGKVIERARKIAARRLEVAESDVEFEDGEFSVKGASARAIHIQEVAEAAYEADDLPDDAEPGLEATAFYDPSNYTFSFGTHVAIVEVDPETGEIEFERYVAVDDVGERINPKVVEGQIHGGVVQGIGQALYEGVKYDDNGTVVTGSFQDYAVPRAPHVPEMELDGTVTECPHNPLGAKGVGEAGAVAAPPAVVNAIVDALEPFGVDHLDMPISHEDVWRAVRDAG